MERVLTIEELVSGRSLRVYTLCKGKRREVVDFLDGLQEHERIKVVAKVQVIADDGIPRHWKAWRPLEGAKNHGLNEIRADQVRLFCFLDDKGQLIITNGCVKKRKKSNPEDIRRARELRAAYLRHKREKPYARA